MIVYGHPGNCGLGIYSRLMAKTLDCEWRSIFDAFASGSAERHSVFVMGANGPWILNQDVTIPFWEYQPFPPIPRSAGFIACPSRFISTMFAGAVIPIIATPATRSCLGDSIFYSFDSGSCLHRKNPRCLVDAHQKMKNRVPLIIKSNIDAPAWARVPGVEWINSFLPERDYEKLWERCMIYVSPHRSEGIGMSIVEAMGRGKPVVATGYGGNTEFMRSSFSEMIPYSWVPVPSDVRETYRPIAGFPVPDPCSDSLAVILDRLVEDRRRLERMADAASQRHSAMVEEWNVNMPIIIGKII